jgi:hypothetical protein
MQPLFELRIREMSYVRRGESVKPEVDAADVGAVQRTYCWRESRMESLTWDVIYGARTVQILGTFFGNALASPQDCRRANVVEPLRRATRWLS